MGHKQETCRNTKPEAKKLAESMAAKKLAEKKAKENKAKREREKKKKEEQKKLAEKKKLDEVKKTRANSTSSSDCDSPVLVEHVDARANRARGLLGQNTGGAGNFYDFPTIHENIEQRTMEELAEELGRVKLARKEGASPTIEGNISGSSNMKIPLPNLSSATPDVASR